jgi:peptidylprolyl isomerase/FKBP-type peptidyl-prolyl cis-trans isomerase FklB
MKRYLYVLLMAIAAISLPSCGDDNEVVIDEAWKTANEEAFNKTASDPAYGKITSQSNMGHIYYKVIKQGEGTKPIYYTSRVKVYYTGALINDYIFGRAEHPDQFPVEFAVKNVVDGWKTALQQMHEGDRWEIWIPQQLGYGTYAQSNSAGVVSIPAYSTLIFEVEVVKVSGIEEP